MAAVAVAALVFAGIAQVARLGPRDSISLLIGGGAIVLLAGLGSFRLALPVIWLIAAMVSWNHPGDEYMLFVFSCAPAAWIIPLLGSTHIGEVLPVLFSAGLATMALVGWLMDGLRVRRVVWLPLFLLGAPALVLSALSEYPSYERAISKNGSLTAYMAAATNLSLYLASILAILAALIGRTVSFVRRSFKTKEGSADTVDAGGSSRLP